MCTGARARRARGPTAGVANGAGSRVTGRERRQKGAGVPEGTRYLTHVHTYTLTCTLSFALHASQRALALPPPPPPPWLAGDWGPAPISAPAPAPAPASAPEPAVHNSPQCSSSALPRDRLLNDS
eukprot:scaffold43348_cov65-Phaeocystis_antarctica.AAC.12